MTDLKKTEVALRTSEQKYRTLLETTSQGYWRLSPDLETVEVNPSFCKMLGYSPHEMIGRTPFEFVDDDNRKIFVKQTSRINTTNHRGYEITLTKKTGAPLQTYFNASTIRDESGEITGSFALITDNTERKRMEEDLRRSETQKQAILDASIDRLRYVDKDMKIIWANRTTVMGLDIPPEAIKGQTCYKLFLDRDTPCKGCPNVKALKTGKIERAVMHQSRSRGKKGESFWDTYIVPIKNKTGDIESFIQVARNITDHQKAKKHIHRLTHELIKAQETERKMISRELHDRVAQDLSASKMTCDMILKGSPELPDKIKEKMNKISDELQKTITAIRDLAYELRPVSLDQMGLIETIFQFCEEFSQKTGLSADFTSAGMDGVDLDFDTEINLYRLVQEGLNNIRKHAEASHVIIRLAAAYPNIILRIIDNGRGFDVNDRLANSLNEKRMGLRSMEERVYLLYGSIEIQSRPGQGTKILIIIPQPEKKHDRQKNPLNC